MLNSSVAEPFDFGAVRLRSHPKIKNNSSIFFAKTFKVLKVQFLIKMDLKNLHVAFAHDTTELPNYNL